MNRKKIRIVTLGCSKNIVDSEKLLRQVQANGFNIAHETDNSPGGTVIINTCGFINDAKEESIDTIFRYIRAKESGLIDNLYVTGCLTERYRDALKKEIPEVDKYFGVNSTKEILKELGIRYRDDLMNRRIITGPGHYAYLKISEGCDRTCAFCIIPTIRGKYISRPIDDLVTEAGHLAESGVRELILIAQDLSYYGIDLYKTQKLGQLVSELLKIQSFDFIRLHYLYPANFPAGLIPLIAENPRICRYIDIPIQHISDKMLGLMKRSHNRRETEAILNRLRRELPGAAIRTTLIAGHPGESEDEFLELRDFIKTFRFDRLGVFAYSHEEGTAAYENFMDEIPETVKEERVSELMSIQQEISSELNRSMAGKILKVIVDRGEGDYFIGRTEFDSPEVDQEVLIHADNNISIGNFCNVEITGSSDFDLFGRLV